MEIEGKIIQELGIQEGVSKVGNPWKKGEWLLETPGMYPKKVKFTVFGENRVADLGPKLQLGKDVILSVDIESREFNGRWYTDVNAYAVRESMIDNYGPQGSGYPPAPGYQQPVQPTAHQGGAFGPAPAAPPSDFGVPGGFPPPPAAGGTPLPPAPAESSDDLPF